MSKTLGNILDPKKMVEIFGPDGLRYLLLREVPFDKDGDITIEILVNRYNADLANELGNLFSRTISMISKYAGGTLPTGAFGPGSELYDDLAAALGGYRRHMDRMEFSRALGAYWTIVQRANRFIEEKRPWDIAKDPSKADELASVLRELVAVILSSGVVLFPFMPAKMEAMLVQLGSAPAGIDTVPPVEVVVEGLRQPAPLFPRIQEDPESLL